MDLVGGSRCCSDLRLRLNVRAAQTTPAHDGALGGEHLQAFGGRGRVVQLGRAAK